MLPLKVFFSQSFYTLKYTPKNRARFLFYQIRNKFFKQKGKKPGGHHHPFLSKIAIHVIIMKKSSRIQTEQVKFYCANQVLTDDDYG